MTPIAPPFPYYGAKAAIASRIVSLMPAHDHYIEPFAGSLSVLLAKPASKHETVNDLDQRLMTFWRVLRDQPDELAQVCALTPHSRAEFETCRDNPLGDTDIETARRVWVQLTQGRSGYLGNTGWRFTIRPERVNMVRAGRDQFLERFPAVVRRISHVSMECRPAEHVIADYGAHPGNLLYVDPPYLRSTRNTSGDVYGHDMPDDDQHEALAQSLTLCQATVLVSGYPSPLYDQLYEGWYTAELAARSGQGNIIGVSGGRTEVIWSNRPITTQLHLWNHDEH